MNYLLINRYAIYALVLVMCAIFIIGTALTVWFFMRLSKVEPRKHWTWGTPRSRER
jgi:hypothetical protein